MLIFVLFVFKVFIFFMVEIKFVNVKMSVNEDFGKLIVFVVWNGNVFIVFVLM